MKKTFVLLAALILMGSTAFAGGGFDLGVKAGYQAAKLSYQKADIKDGFSNHFVIGLFGRVNIGKFYVQPEVLYFKTSNVFDLGVSPIDIGNNDFIIPTGANVNLTLNQMNLQVPVLLGLNILDLGVLSLRAQVGPTANFVLQSKTLIDYSYTISGGGTQQAEANTDKGFDTKTIAWGLQAGLGLDLLKFITLDVNYNFGLSKVFNGLNDTELGHYFDFTNIDNTKQNMFMVTVGIKIL